MSELMAIESIVEEYAKFLGYFTEHRVPFKLKKGNSDIDVLGYNRKTKKSLMIECKAWGSPNQYYSFNDSKSWFKKQFQTMIGKWEFFKKSSTNKWNLSKLNEIWFVIPGFCDDRLQTEAEISKELHCTVKIIPIHNLLLDIMFEVKKDKDVRRKRYPNAALEFCRWLLRSYETGHLNLIDVDLKLKKEKQTYEELKRHYLKGCIRIVQRNAEKRRAGVDTRLKTLEILNQFKKASIPQIENRSKKYRYNLNYNRINVGLGTWIDLGIVSEDKNGKFFINNPFVNLVKKELLKKRPSSW